MKEKGHTRNKKKSVDKRSFENNLFKTTRKYVHCFIETQPFAVTQTAAETIKLEELSFCTLLPP
jgi:hypothetical protein